MARGGVCAARRHRPGDLDRGADARPKLDDAALIHRAALAGAVHRRDGLAARAGASGASGCSSWASPRRSWRGSPRRSASTSARDQPRGDRAVDHGRDRRRPPRARRRPARRRARAGSTRCPLDRAGLSSPRAPARGSASARSCWPTSTAVRCSSTRWRAQCECAELERVVVVLGAPPRRSSLGSTSMRAEPVVCERWDDGPGRVAAARDRASDADAESQGDRHARRRSRG